MRVEQMCIGGGTADVTAFGVSETVPDRLRAAAGYVRGHWRQGVLCDQFGMVCAVGALLGLRENAVVDTNTGYELLALDPVAYAAVRAVAEYVAEKVPGPRLAADEVPVGLVAQWNDCYAGDGVEVAEVFEKVAARWEESGA